MIQPLVDDAGKTARACCRNESSGGAMRLERGSLDTALLTDSVRLFEIVKTAAGTLASHPHALALDRSKSRRLISKPQDVTRGANSGA